MVTDWGAQHAGVATALAGLDMVMPYGAQYWGDNLTQSVVNGSVPESRVDDMATRLVFSFSLFLLLSSISRPLLLCSGG